MLVGTDYPCKATIDVKGCPPEFKNIPCNDVLARRAMSYFLYDNEVKLNQRFTLKGEEASHLLRSRRIQPGELVEIQDTSHQRFQCQVESVSKRELILRSVEQVIPPAESPLKLHLYQALIREKPLEIILQKSTELGATSINLFQSRYSQRLKKDSAKSGQRWQKICIEACKQSGRTTPPAIHFFESIDAVVQTIQSKTAVPPALCFSTSEQGISLDQLQLDSNEVNLLIGPEGGWFEDELAPLDPFHVHLGQRILRSETAAVTAVALLQFLFGDLSVSTESSSI